jgi:hypothetical protein
MSFINVLIKNKRKDCEAKCYHCEKICVRKFHFHILHAHSIEFGKYDLFLWNKYIGYYRKRIKVI